MNNLDLGNVKYVNDEKIACQVFPEGIKKSNFYICVLTEKVLYFQDNQTSPVMCEPISDVQRVVQLDDIEKVVYPTEDKKIMLWIKIKGKNIMRIFVKSTGKYFDVRIGTPEETKKVYELLSSLLNQTR